MDDPRGNEDDALAKIQGDKGGSAFFIFLRLDDMARQRNLVCHRRVDARAVRNDIREGFDIVKRLPRLQPANMAWRFHWPKCHPSNQKDLSVSKNGLGAAGAQLLTTPITASNGFSYEHLLCKQRFVQ